MILSAKQRNAVKVKQSDLRMKDKEELVIDNSFPAGLETPEELLQWHATALRFQLACLALCFGQSITRLD